MKQKARNTKVRIVSVRLLSRQAAHVAQPAKSTGMSRGMTPKPEMSEKERTPTRSIVLMEPVGPIAHSTPERRTGVVQMRSPTTRHQSNPDRARNVESHWSGFMAS